MNLYPNVDDIGRSVAPLEHIASSLGKHIEINNYCICTKVTVESPNNIVCMCYNPSLMSSSEQMVAYLVYLKSFLKRAETH